MLTNVTITGVHGDVDEDLRKYILKRIGKLDTFIPRHARESARAEVRMISSHARDKRQSGCEVTLHLPKESLQVKETTVNMYAAVDIVDARLRSQLVKYKQRSIAERGKVRHLWTKWRLQQVYGPDDEA
jgi:putative sigma-54 modulation protein